MAGNPEHTAALLAKYPDAKSIECNGYYGKATLTGSDGYAAEVTCPACEREERTRHVLAFTPPRFRSAVTLPPKVEEWAAAGRSAQGLYLAGPVGTGKTHTAWSAVAAWCLAAGITPVNASGSTVDWGGRITPSVIFTRMTDLLDDLRPGDDSRQRIRDCQNTRLLVIDDLGAEKASEWTQERFYSVIDHRYAECMPLMVTSNIPPRGLADQTGERAASRLAEMCEVIAMTGSDRRRPTA